MSARRSTTHIFQRPTYTTMIHNHDQIPFSHLTPCSPCYIPLNSTKFHPTQQTRRTPKHRGHGTHVEDDKLISTVSGVVERVNKLISVRPLKSR